MSHVANRRRQDAEVHDYYATDPKAVELLLEHELLCHRIWDPACGEGHILKVFAERGYDVMGSDIVDRGYGFVEDFLTCKRSQHPYRTSHDIVTNPPYKYARQFVETALEFVPEGRKVAMFLKLTFLEGQARRELFRKYPPQTVYVSSARLECGKNGEFTGNSAVAYCWIVWEKGYKGPTVLKWIN